MSALFVSSSRRPSKVAAILIAAAGALLSAADPAAAGALTGLTGSWGGGGSATFEGGSRERFRCNGYYRTVGEDLSMVIRCASPGGAKVELRGMLHENGGKVSGSWEERTYNATGSISGSTAPGTLRVAISGAINGSMAVSYSGTSQTVSITTTGTSLRSINISFNRN